MHLGVSGPHPGHAHLRELSRSLAVHVAPKVAPGPHLDPVTCSARFTQVPRPHNHPWPSPTASRSPEPALTSFPPPDGMTSCVDRRGSDAPLHSDVTCVYTDATSHYKLINWLLSSNYNFSMDGLLIIYFCVGHGP